MRELFDAIGIDVQLMIAGFSGGVVNAYITKARSVIDVVGSIVTGTLMANYLTGPAANYLGGPFAKFPGAAAFLVGLGAVFLAQWALTSIRQKVSTINGNFRPNGGSK